ncbi:hypothetical protein GCM10027562_22400 [Arthrobacter pigmenti]
MLEGCGVENDFWTPCCEDRLDGIPIANVCQNYVSCVKKSMPQNRQLRALQAGFITIQHYELRWSKFYDLPTKFRTN